MGNYPTLKPLYKESVDSAAAKSAVPFMVATLTALQTMRRFI